MSKLFTMIVFFTLLAGNKPDLPRQQAVSLSYSTVIVVLRDQVPPQALASLAAGQPLAARQEAVIRTLQSTADSSQKDIRSWLASPGVAAQIDQVVPFWIFNGLAVTATPEIIAQLKQRPDVVEVIPDQVIPAPEMPALSPPASSSATENLALVDAPALWFMGVRGQNVVVASMDTGVDLQHPDLVSRWRGGANSWFDPYGEHPLIPTDLNGHGTWTMGVMVGQSSSGPAVGIAPDARWIAVKIFNDRNRATAAAIHRGYQWLLDPDGDPTTSDAPQVVNNSWDFGAPGCNLTFQNDLNILRAAGILPIFAAGNFGPSISSDASPANNPGAFAVGAVDNLDQILAFSSRGPTDCGSASRVYPSLVAPGSDIYTTDRYQLYTTESGTSLSSPHVAGGLALLLSRFPGLPVVLQEAALQQGVVDLGSPNPDDTFGFGRLDLLISYEWLLANYEGPLLQIYIPIVIQQP